jgi:hypothetical protein
VQKHLLYIPVYEYLGLVLSVTRRPWSTRGFCTMGGKNKANFVINIVLSCEFNSYDISTECHPRYIEPPIAVVGCVGV